MSRKIHLNDEVIVLTGNYKGKIGKVIEILSNSKVLVKGVNLVKKHQKSVNNLDKSGSIIEKESPIHISNLGIFNKNTKKMDKVKFRISLGKKIRVFKSNGENIKF